MNETFKAQSAVELAVVERSGFIESRHLGSAIVVDTAAADTGQTLIELGAVDEPVLTRSCLKPFQAIACMELGVPLSGLTAALATASHNAEFGQVEVVEKMLASVNLSEADLQCPSVAPADRDARIATRGSGRLTSPLYYNCSGKHAAFLMAQKLTGEPVKDYLDPVSRIQRHVRAVVERYCGQAPLYTGIDGCGAPVHALDLRHLALGIGRVGARTTPEAATLMEGVFAEPWAIEGHGAPNSVVIERLGVFAKIGAEGVLVMSTPAGVAVAVKTLDGASRANTLIALELLVAAGALSAESALDVLGDVVPAITGGTKSDGTVRTVGEIKTAERIRQLLHERAVGA
jgi:L-asparaginase II